MKFVVLACYVVCVLGSIDDQALRFFPHGQSGPQQAGEHWAVIVAGSDGWYNYRHQADACHAYQVLRRHGFPEDRIITMMYDDIANNPENPTPGKVINHPDGPDVYSGVKIDYSKEDVNPSNFLAVISGDTSAVGGIGSGRVVRSGPNDHIFVNFVDHGAPGILAFPRDELHVSDFMKTIRYMYRQKKYKQLVFYVEACESGSMFHHHLPKNISVFATTAANPIESSYACYLDKARNTYLGDVYSVKWMEDSDKENLGIETLHKQFEIVKHETNTSHVKQYGDRTISSEVVSEFQGETEYHAPEPLYVPDVPLDAIPSGEVRESILRHKMLTAESEQEKLAALAEYGEMIKERERIETTMRHIVSLATRATPLMTQILGVRRELVHLDCYEPAARAFDQLCFDLSQHEYALRNMYLLVNMCEEGIPSADIINAVKSICM